MEAGALRLPAAQKGILNVELCDSKTGGQWMLSPRFYLSTVRLRFARKRIRLPLKGLIEI